ncbi:MAG: hypothetical protein A2W35_02640 [Chloroflexi bacterium RBG_16_57_11]|nr:MAG: hypothetical protein A2W35_02640 [Chloroflexi bacterium RBG_16_57_11]
MGGWSFTKQKNVGLTCSHCGTSRPTLSKWANRYHEFGIKGDSRHSKKDEWMASPACAKNESGFLINLKREWGTKLYTAIKDLLEKVMLAQ